jgi:hypothetical protein
METTHQNDFEMIFWQTISVLYCQKKKTKKLKKTTSRTYLICVKMDAKIKKQAMFHIKFWTSRPEQIKKYDLTGIIYAGKVYVTGIVYVFRYLS